MSKKKDKKIKDIVLVVCLNGKEVTDKYECFVSPYKQVGKKTTLPEMYEYAKSYFGEIMLTFLNGIHKMRKGPCFFDTSISLSQRIRSLQNPTWILIWIIMRTRMIILAAFQLTKMMTWISLNSMMMKSKKTMTRNKYSL